MSCVSDVDGRLRRSRTGPLRLDQRASNSPATTPAMNSRHACRANVRTLPPACFESRTPILGSAMATSTQHPVEHRVLRRHLIDVCLCSTLCPSSLTAAGQWRVHLCGAERQPQRRGRRGRMRPRRYRCGSQVRRSLTGGGLRRMSRGVKQTCGAGPSCWVACWVPHGRPCVVAPMAPSVIDYDTRNQPRQGARD
jgi:hypothetical protein